MLQVFMSPMHVGNNPCNTGHDKELCGEDDDDADAGHDDRSDEGDDHDAEDNEPDERDGSDGEGEHSKRRGDDISERKMMKMVITTGLSLCCVL